MQLGTGNWCYIEKHLWLLLQFIKVNLFLTLPTFLSILTRKQYSWINLFQMPLCIFKNIVKWEDVCQNDWYFIKIFKYLYKVIRFYLMEECLLFIFIKTIDWGMNLICLSFIVVQLLIITISNWLDFKQTLSRFISPLYPFLKDASHLRFSCICYCWTKSIQSHCWP